MLRPLAKTLAAALLLPSVIVACGSDATRDETTDEPLAGSAGATGEQGGAGTAGSDAGAGGMGAAPTTAPERYFAVQHIKLGDVDESGKKSSTEWRKIGLDLDGVSSTLGSGPHCQPAQDGKAKAIEEDGDGGIDNSFGRNIVPLFGLGSTPPTLAMSESIAHGEFSLLLGLNGLPEGPEGADLVGSLFAAQAPRDAKGKPIAPSAQQWEDGSFAWDVLDTFLVSKDPLISQARLTGGTLKGNEWRTDAADVTLLVPLNGVVMELRLHGARVKASFSASHEKIDNGVLAGVLFTDEFVEEFARVGPQVSPTLCSQALFDGVLQALQQSSDILKDQTQDPEKICDAISAGLMFDAALAQAASVVAADPASEQACPLGKPEKMPVTWRDPLPGRSFVA